MNRFSSLILFVSVLICLLSATSIATHPTSEATFLRHTESGLTYHTEKSDFQSLLSDDIDQTLNWTYNLTDAIYRSAAIADHTYILAGSYLNIPEETELFTIEGAGIPEWTYSGEDFYTDASDDSTTLTAINVSGTGLDVLKWTSPGTGTPDWTYTIAGYSATSSGPITVSDDGSTIAVTAAPSGTDAHLLLFDANSSTPLINYEATGLGFPRYIKINTDGRYPAFIASATLVVFDRNTLSVREQISMGASNSAMDISGDGDLIAYGWTNMQVKQWNGSSYQTLWTWDSGSYYVTRIAISANGSTIVSCWYTTSFNSVKVAVHDVSSSTPLWVHTYPTSSGTYQESVSDVDVSDDGSLIIVGSLGDAENLNPEVHVFQRDHEPHVIFTVDMPGSVHSVDISGDGNYATACGKHVHDNQMGRGGDLVSITLEGHNELSGALSGILGPGFFHVVDSIYVESDDTLRIVPATTINFDGPYPFNIYGLLLAEGTESDSIIFTTDTTANPSRWRGIQIDNDNSSCLMEYCVVSECSHCSAVILEGTNVNHIIRSSSIRNNELDQFPNGSAIYVNQGQHCIRDCNIIRNDGLGILCSVDSRVIISNCTVASNSHDGVYCYNTNDTTVIEHCTIINNTTNGIRAFAYSNVFINNCTVSGNLGFGIDNRSYGNNLGVIITNTIIEGNGSAGVQFYESDSNGSITYSDFYNNAGGNFTGNVPDTLGEIITTNLNGDSCDAYFNIFIDPLFEDPIAGDFHLLSTSPCIDAGDPAYPLDPDSTIADMGAFYYDHPPWVGDPSNQTIPSHFCLYPNYPNPFNPVTTIRFDLICTDYVTLKIFNTLGHEITTLVDANLTPGTYQIPFIAENLSSGIYFYTLTSTTHTQARKMVLLK